MNEKRIIQAALFDMDDTLIATRGRGWETMSDLLEEMDIILTHEEHKSFERAWRSGDANNTEKWLGDVLRKYMHGDAVVVLRNFYARYEEAIVHAPLLPGAKNMIKVLAGKVPTAIVTASKRAQVKRVIEAHQWEPLISLVVAQEDYKNPKPDPEAYLIAAKKLGIAPEHCIVFEDSTSGLRAAKAAGMYTVAITVGSHPDVDASYADAIYPSFQEVAISSFIFKT